MPDSDQAAMARQFQALLDATREAPHYFALMRAGEGVAIEAHRTRQPDQLEAACARKGGQGPAVKGVMTADAGCFYLQAWADEVPAGLPRQARRYFDTLGVTVRMEISLPNGERLDGEGEDPPPDPAAELTARLKAVAPRVKAAADHALAGADKLAAAVKAAAAEIAAGDLDKAAALVETVERGLDTLGTIAQADQGALRAGLKSEYNALQDDLETALEGGGPLAAKIRTVAGMFATELDRDLKKAGQALAMLKQLLGAGR